MSLARSTATITAWNAVSRITGFVRVLAVGAALGTTFLGNTYQSSNLVSNILFEFLAAGLLAAPLVPAFVGLLDRGRRDDAQGLAGGLLTISVIGLGAVVIVGMVAAPLIMRALTVGVSDPAIRSSEVDLGTFWLWFFLPQVVLYAVGALASALLHAERRFAAVSFAPVANNVIVTVTMIVFVIMRHGAAGGGLQLTTSQKLVVGAGTTAGVLAMTLVPLVALRRTGVRLRPGPVDRSSPLLRDVVHVGLWSGAFLAANQLLIAVTLVLANRVEGGVIAYQIAFTFFLLPHALLAHPIFTALYPRLAADVHADRWDAFGADVAGGVRLTVFLVLPAAALLAALGEPLMRTLRFGAIDASGAALVGRVLAAYAIGLGGYAVLLLLVRAATAAGQAREAAAVGAGVLVAGTVLMAMLSSAAHGDNRVVVLGLAHSVAVIFGAVTLHELVRRRSGARVAVLPTVVRSAAIAAGGGGVAWGVAHAISSGGSRAGAAAALVLGGLAGTIVMAGAHWLLRSPELESLRLPDFGLDGVRERVRLSESWPPVIGPTPSPTR